MSTPKRVTTTARVQVTVEIALASVWGPDCTTGQAFDQARQGAVQAIERQLAPDTRIKSVSATLVTLYTACET